MARASAVAIVTELLAAAVLAVVGVRTAGLCQTYSKHTSQMRATLVGGLAKPGIEMGTLNGISLGGQYVDPAWTNRTRIALFLLRGRSASSDLRFWNSVAEEFSASPWMQFRGYCEASACSVAARNQREVMIFRAGAERTLEAVLQADQQGAAVLVTAADKREVADPLWRGVSPARFRSEILATLR